jgi:hypothetical protein
VHGCTACYSWKSELEFFFVGELAYDGERSDAAALQTDCLTACDKLLNFFLFNVFCVAFEIPLRWPGTIYSIHSSKQIRSSSTSLAFEASNFQVN